MTTAPEYETDTMGTRRTGDVVVDTARTVGDSLARIGVAAVDGPLLLVPENLRRNVHDATSNLFSAMARLHLSLVETTVEAVTGRPQPAAEGRTATPTAAPAAEAKARRSSS